MSDFTTAKLWGRKWAIKVVMTDGTTALDVSDSDFEPGALRATFRIEQSVDSPIPAAEIKIFNLTGNTEKKLIGEGARVIVEAGYQEGAYGQIFDGRVWQVRRNRQNVVDYSLILSCSNIFYVNDPSGFVRIVTEAGQDMRAQLNTLAESAGFELGHVTEDLDTSKLPRGKVFFGTADKYLRQIARYNSGSFLVTEGKVHITRITDTVPAGELLVLSPETGLIGTPNQCEYGVSFRALLDPRIKLSPQTPLVKIDQAMIRAMKLQYKQGQMASTLDQDGIYKIGAVTYIGDTRGNDWYVDAIGVAQVGKQPYLLGADGVSRDAVNGRSS